MRFWPLICALALALAASVMGCNDRTKTRRILEPYTVVPGTPTVDTGKPGVDIDPTQQTSQFGIATPYQCDSYQQLSVRKVDILWVVDSSGSMAPKQARLIASFNSFISQLVTAQPPIDFHIAVATTDTDDPATRGSLRPWTVGAMNGTYISCSPQMAGGSLCNTSPTVGDTASAVSAFNAMVASVGINGSASEKGLLNTYFVLTNPANIDNASTPGFIRADASLYVIVVSDEDDSSCSPLVEQSVCTADPGCRCASDSVLSGAGGFGATTYFTRFLETYKGYGNAELVALAAVVGDDQGPVPSQFGDPSSHEGCCHSLNGTPCPTSGGNDGGYEVAYFGSRYVKVANDTGGVAISICQQDDGGVADAGFSNSLATLGYNASGLRKEFRLSRGPEVLPMGGVATGIQLFVSKANAPTCMVDGNCMSGQSCKNNRCADPVAVSTTAAPNGAEYVKCDNNQLRNVVRFDGTAVPESLSTVTVCYDVQANFSNSCP